MTELRHYIEVLNELTPRALNCRDDAQREEYEQQWVNVRFYIEALILAGPEVYEAEWVGTKKK